MIEQTANHLPQNYRHYMKKIWPVAVKMASQYYPFTPREIENGNPEGEQSAYRQFLAEVYQIAALAIARAHKTYDRRKGASFESWVYFYLRKSLSETFADHTCTCRLSIPITRDLLTILELNSPTAGSHKIVLSSIMKKRLNRFLEEQGYQAKVAGRTVEASINGDGALLKLTVKRYYHFASLEEYLENHGDDGNYDHATKGQDPSGPKLLQRICLSIRYLPPVQRKVLILLYGLYGCTPRGYAEVGRELNRTEQRIRQIENEALDTLRQKIFQPSY